MKGVLPVLDVVLPVQMESGMADVVENDANWDLGYIP